MTLKVNEPTDEVVAMQPAIAKMAALVGGTDAMRKAARAYLPQWTMEDDEDYRFRLSTSTLYNATGWTLNNLAGKPFSEPITVTDVDPTLEEWLDNVDLCGHDLNNFAHGLFLGGLTDGQVHVFVDFPVTNGELKTKADEAAAGVRPYAVKIDQSQILGWQTSYINGYEKLMQLRFLECEYEEDGAWGVKEVQQVRVLFPGGWQKYRKVDNKDEWTLYDEGVTTLDFIPFITFYTRRTGFMQATPPLEDLADLNIKHWQSQSDQDSLLHTARVPLLVRIGLQDDPEAQAKIGKSITDLPINCDMKYVEHSGAAIQAGRESLQDLEDQMRSLGGELLTQRPGDRTATESAIDSAQSQSQLSTMATNLGDFLDQVLDIMATWAKLKPGAHCKIFNDFTAILANDKNILQISQALIAFRNGGLLDDESAFEEGQRYGIINSDLDWKDVQARLSVQGPSLLPQPVPKPQPEPQQ